MIVAETLTPEATAAPIGAAVGAVGSWGLALLTDALRDMRRARRVAALLVLTELTPIGAALSVLRATGVVSPPLPNLSRPLWESQGAALLYRADLVRAGVLDRAYSGSSDIAAICQEPGRDFTQGTDAKLADDVFGEVVRALGELAPLADLEVGGGASPPTHAPRPSSP